MADTVENQNPNVRPPKTLEEDIALRWFEAIASKKKKAEGRVLKKWVKDLQVGDTIVWTNKQDDRRVTVRVTELTPYTSFEKLLSQEGLKHVLPGVGTIDEGVGVYREWYSPAMEAEYGVVAIHMEVI